MKIVETQKRKFYFYISHKIKQNSSSMKQFTAHKFFDRFTKLTNKQFSKPGLPSINKAFKYNIITNFSTSSYEIVRVETELALNDMPNIIKSDFLKFASQNNKMQIVNTIQCKVKSNDLRFTRADKGDTVTTIQYSDNINKTKYVV